MKVLNFYGGVGIGYMGIIESVAGIGVELAYLGACADLARYYMITTKRV